MPSTALQPEFAEMLRWIILSVCLALSSSGLAAGSTTLVANGWHTLPIGGGGNVIGQIMICDLGPGACSPGHGTVTKMARTDVGGAVYWWNPSTSTCGDNANHAGPCWQNILTPSRGFLLTNPAQADIGARDMTISPHNTQVVYIYVSQDGCIWKSTTGPGGNYTQPAGWTCSGYSNTPNNGSNVGQHTILADPNNENIVYASNPGDTRTNPKKGFVTYNGGTTFTDTSTLTNPIPTSTYGGGITIAYAFDTSNGTTSTCPGRASVCTKNVFAMSNGNGVYKSVDGGANFTSLAGRGSPGGCLKIEADPSGVLWCHGANSLFRWVPSAVNSTTGTWTNTLTVGGNGLADFAIDYNKACSLASQVCHIVAITYDGFLNETTNSGSSYIGQNNNGTVAATDAPWLQIPGANCCALYLHSQSAAFDPTRSNLLTVTGGAGYWTTNPTASAVTAYVWISQTIDMQELVSTRIISPPGLGYPAAGFWDRGVFAVPSQTAYAQYYAPNAAITGNRAWDVAFAGDYSSSHLIVQINANGKAYSTTGVGNGAPANWSTVAAVPSEITGGKSGGTILPLNINTWLWKVGQGGDVYYTTNGGRSWTQLSLPNGWGGGATDKNGIMDTQTPNVAYIYNNSASPGIYKFFISGGVPTAVRGFSGTMVNINIGLLIGVPSTAGDMYFSNSAGSGSVPLHGALYECTDSAPSGTSAGTITCQTVSTRNFIPGTGTHYGANVSGVQIMAAGAPKAGGSGYSGIYFYGSIDGKTVGVYQTYDHFQTFTKIADQNFQGCGIAGACSPSTSDMFPGRWDQPTTMAASPDTQGLVYICYSGTACIFGKFP
jgi:hypothetical protein